MRSLILTVTDENYPIDVNTFCVRSRASQEGGIYPDNYGVNRYPREISHITTKIQVQWCCFSSLDFDGCLVAPFGSPERCHLSFG